MNDSDQLLPQDRSANFSSAQNPVGLLMQVEVPVSVSLGRTRMRLKDLLELSQGAVVELDEYAGDEVEILVNQRVLARGEVVAVDGNYGVRITSIGGSAHPADSSGSPLLEAE